MQALRLARVGKAIACLAGLLSACGVGDCASTAIPLDIFAGESRGPFRTGTIEAYWVDSGRPEPGSTGPRQGRHLVVQIWYPATIEGDPPRAPYVLRRELYAQDEERRWLDEVSMVRTNSVFGAPLAREPARFPVLIYNPGASHPQFSATFQTEFLASHGYVVVAIGHTGINGIERFPDGYVYRAPSGDPLDIPPDDAALPMAEQFREKMKRSAAQLMPVHVQDIRFVLDRLGELDATRRDRFYRRLDLDRVGSLGWSLGGALSLQASRDEPRIKAAANLDGWLYTDVQETGTNRPILIMHSGDPFGYAPESAAARERRLVAESQPWKLYARTGADWYDVILKRAEHDHFSDRTLFEPADVNLIHPRVAHEIINRVTLEFFDKYLRQISSGSWLAGQGTPPDIEVQRNPQS